MAVPPTSHASAAPPVGSGRAGQDPPQRTFRDSTAEAALAPLTTSGPYLPWGAGVMRPGGLVAVCNDLVLNARCRVVELGGGTSTVLLARALRQRWPDGAARQVVVEHDRTWASWIREQLAREGLASAVTVLHAPLRPHPLAVGDLGWYDAQVLDAGLDGALGADEVDLLVVDGPPADTADKVLARYPALPALRARLAPGATVVLDDVERPGEQEVLRRWAAETGLRFDDRGEQAGVALGRVPGGSA